jgi:hypothetical protein
MRALLPHPKLIFSFVIGLEFVDLVHRHASCKKIVSDLHEHIVSLIPLAFAAGLICLAHLSGQKGETFGIAKGQWKRVLIFSKVVEKFQNLFVQNVWEVDPDHLVFFFCFIKKT